MPLTIDEEAFKGGKILSLDLSKPQGPVGATGSVASGGLPVKQIPFLEWPRVVYLHPNEPTKVVTHRNDKFEVVGEEVVQTEHLTRVVQNATELEALLNEGWVKEPYIPKPLPDVDAGLYKKARKKA